MRSCISADFLLRRETSNSFSSVSSVWDPASWLNAELRTCFITSSCLEGNSNTFFLGSSLAGPPFVCFCAATAALVIARASALWAAYLFFFSDFFLAASSAFRVASSINCCLDFGSGSSLLSSLIESSELFGTMSGYSGSLLLDSTSWISWTLSSWTGSSGSF